MTRAPNLEMPPTRPAGSGGMSARLLVLQLILLVVLILSIFISRDRSTPRPVLKGETVLPEKIKQIAVRLENLNLDRQAADAWEEYLAMAVPDRYETGRYRLRIAKLRQEQGDSAEALSQLLHAEALLDGTEPALQREINLRVTECLRNRGQFAELARERAARATGDPDAATTEGQQVVAQIGDEKITVADFDRMLGDEIELLVKSRLGQTAADEDELRKQMYKQFADPEARKQQLQQIVTSRVLADEARRTGLNDSQDFRARLAAMADNLLASKLLFDEVNKQATVTDADVERYYEANRSRYEHPASATVAHIQCDSDIEAKTVLERLHGGDSFEDLAKTVSRDLSTQANGGVLSQPVLDDDSAPGIFGGNAEARQKIFAADPGTVLDDPVKTDSGWHVVKVISRKPAEDKPLDDIRDTVRRDTLAARRREVTEKVVSDVLKAAKVSFYPEALHVGQPAAEKKEP